MRANRIRSVPAVLALALAPMAGWAQNAVNVTVEADSTELYVCQKTTVRVYGQIDGAIEADSDQIFSWYIDVLNNNEGVASGYENVLTPMSDNHPDTSGDGTQIGPNLRGVYDTFLLQPGAGKGSRIELVQFEVMATAPGVVTIGAAAGTTIGGSLSDFLVAQSGGGSFSGGNYSAASVSITVSELDLEILNTQTELVGGMMTVTFDPVPGFDHTLQYSETLQQNEWIDIPGGPFNAGVFSEVDPGTARRFYRVGVTPQ